MAFFEIIGGNKLNGEIIPQGSKNEALQVLCAVLLTDEEVKIENVPNIRDVNKLIELLQFLGVKTIKTNEDSYTFCAKNINIDALHQPEYLKKATELRGSIMLVGPLLARFGYAVVPQPGGDKIGRRRLDTHYIGFQNLGAEVTFNNVLQCYEIKGKSLQGSYMLLDEASVTGTANIVMASVLAKGKTTIFNAACEPYLLQLCSMLNRMGAKISGVGSNLLKIEGVDGLHGCSHKMLPYTAAHTKCFPI